MFARLILALVCVLPAASALAEIVTYDFTGTTTSDFGFGEPVSGSFTYDTAYQPTSITGDSWSYDYQSLYPPFEFSYSTPSDYFTTGGFSEFQYLSVNLNQNGADRLGFSAYDYDFEAFRDLELRFTPGTLSTADYPLPNRQIPLDGLATGYIRNEGGPPEHDGDFYYNYDFTIDSLTRRQPEAPRVPKIHAFVGGVNWPRESLVQQGSRGGDDAQVVYDAIKAWAGNQWADTNPDILVLEGQPAGQNTNRTDFEQQLISVMNNVQPGDKFIFYFSTHGGTAKEDEAVGTYNEITEDSAGDEAFLLTASVADTVTDDQFLSFFQENASSIFIDDVDKLFITDWCHSGGFWGGGDEGDLDKLSRTAILTSASEFKDAFYNPFTGRSLFSRAVAAGFNSQPTSVDDVADHVLSVFSTREYEGEDFPIKSWPIDPVPSEFRTFDKSFGFSAAADWQGITVVPEPSSLLLLLPAILFKKRRISN